MAFVIVNIGSNLGNRPLHLSRAVAALGRAFGNIETSHAVESEPWGFDSTAAFLNIGAAFFTDLEPEGVLDMLQEIERSLSTVPHRTAAGAYADREVDIDIVAIDRLEIDTERLTVPHRHLAERRFFLEPLAELAPGWEHPATGETAYAMLLKLESRK